MSNFPTLLGFDFCYHFVFFLGLRFWFLIHLGLTKYIFFNINKIFIKKQLGFQKINIKLTDLGVIYQTFIGEMPIRKRHHPQLPYRVCNFLDHQNGLFVSL